MKWGGIPLKNLFKILILLTIVVVLGLMVQLFYQNGEKETRNSTKIELNKELKVSTNEKLLNENPRPSKGISIYIGKSVNDFVEKYGEPSRKDLSYYGYDIWVYPDEEKYMLVGVENDTVVTISVIGFKIDTYPFKIGGNLESVYKKYSIQTEVSVENENGVYKFELQENDINARPLIKLGEVYAQLFFDSFDGNLMFIRFSDGNTLVKLHPYDMTYLGELYETELSDEEWILADLASEQQIFELTNIIRKKHSLSSLTWDTKTADVAYFHSKDMYETNTFSHDSEKYGSLADRLEAKEVFYEAAGENIASNYTDSIAVVAGWLNSKGHRETFLSDEFTHIGVGVYKKYYTQNFLRRTWGDN